MKELPHIAFCNRKTEVRTRRAYQDGPMPSDDFILGQIRQCERVIKICEQDHYKANGRRKGLSPGDNEMQERYIAGRQKSYTAIIRFLASEIEGFKKALSYKQKYADILKNSN